MDRAWTLVWKAKKKRSAYVRRRSMQNPEPALGFLSFFATQLSQPSCAESAAIEALQIDVKF